MTREPCGIGQSITIRRPTLLRGSRDWHSGQRGPRRFSNSRSICAPIPSKVTFETTYPLNGSKALMLRTFTPVQGHPDRGCVTRDSQGNPSSLGDEEPFFQDSIPTFQGLARFSKSNHFARDRHKSLVLCVLIRSIPRSSGDLEKNLRFFLTPSGGECPRASVYFPPVLHENPPSKLAESPRESQQIALNSC